MAGIVVFRMHCCCTHKEHHSVTLYVYLSCGGVEIDGEGMELNLLLALLGFVDNASLPSLPPSAAAAAAAINGLCAPNILGLRAILLLRFSIALNLFCF